MWFDNLKGYLFEDDESAKKIAKWVKGEIVRTEEEVFILVPTPRGELIVREGDWVAEDPRGQIRLVRIAEIEEKDHKPEKVGKISPSDIARKKANHA